MAAGKARAEIKKIKKTLGLGYQEAFNVLTRSQERERNKDDSTLFGPRGMNEESNNNNDIQCCGCGEDREGWNGRANW